MKAKKYNVIEDYKDFCSRNNLIESNATASFYAQRFLHRDTKINSKRIHQLYTYTNDQSWQKEYWDNDGVLYRDLDRSDDDTPIEDLGRYEIMFDYDGVRRYCFVDAINMNEALGLFFKNHATVQYRDIVEHLEI